MNIEQERAEFEAAYVVAFPFSSGRPGKFDRDEADGYLDTHLLVGWEMYQAGRAALQSQDREDLLSRIRERLDWLRKCSDLEMGDGDTARDVAKELIEAIDHARRVEGGE